MTYIYNYYQPVIALFNQRGKSGQQRAAYRLMAGFFLKKKKEKVPQKITVSIYWDEGENVR